MHESLNPGYSLRAHWIILAIIAIVLVAAFCFGGGIYAGAWYATSSHAIPAAPTATAVHGTLAQLSGQPEQGVQATFTSQLPWRLRWSCEGSGDLLITVYAAPADTDVLLTIPYHCEAGKTDASSYLDSGSFYLMATGETDWSLVAETR